MVRLALCLVVVSAGTAGATDCVFDGDLPERPAYNPTSDAPTELSWDNGTRRWNVSWYTGPGSWVGNDFDVSTLSAYRAINKIRFYSRSNWPNSQWDGFQVGVFAFSGGIPGSVLWPTSGGGYFFRPSGLNGHVWVEIDIGWTCPATTFAAAQHQYYNWPNCDPWAVDNNPTFRLHSWQYYGGTWSPLSSSNTNIDPYFNLMLRVVVDNETLGVKPSSLGRVKAIYY